MCLHVQCKKRICIQRFQIKTINPITSVLSATPLFLLFFRLILKINNPAQFHRALQTHINYFDEWIVSKISGFLPLTTITFSYRYLPFIRMADSTYRNMFNSD